MGRFRAIVRTIPPVLGGLITTGAGTSPTDATTHLASWWELSGYPAPVWISKPGADHTALVAGPILILLWLIFLWLTRKKGGPLSDKAPAPINALGDRSVAIGGDVNAPVVTQGDGSAAFINNAGSTFHINQVPPAKLPPEAPISIAIRHFPLDYAAGSNVYGITWRKSYSHIRIEIGNLGSDNYFHLDFLIDPQHPIVDAKVRSDYGSCTISQFNRHDVDLIMTGMAENGERTAITTDTTRNPIMFGPPYRLICEKLPPWGKIFVDIATCPINFNRNRPVVTLRAAL